MIVDQCCDALIIIGRQQHGLPFAWPHRERQFAEFLRPVSENASLVRTHSLIPAGQMLIRLDGCRVPGQGCGIMPTTPPRELGLGFWLSWGGLRPDWLDRRR